MHRNSFMPEDISEPISNRRKTLSTVHKSQIQFVDTISKCEFDLQLPKSDDDQNQSDTVNEITGKYNMNSDFELNCDPNTIINDNSSKEQQIEKLAEDAWAIQEKFLWELSLAIKRQIMAEKGLDSKEAIDVSTVSCQKIIDCASIETPHPNEWESWIHEKYSQLKPPSQ